MMVTSRFESMNFYANRSWTYEQTDIIEMHGQWLYLHIYIHMSNEKPNMKWIYEH